MKKIGGCFPYALAGFLFAANVCRAGDVAQFYRAGGSRFLRRLLNTGLGKVEGGKEEERDVYLRLSVTVLPGLARVPEVAADEGAVSTVTVIAEVLSKSFKELRACRSSNAVTCS